MLPSASMSFVVLTLIQTSWLSFYLITAKDVYIFGVTPEKGLIGVQINSIYHNNGEAIPITFPVEGVTMLKDCKLISYDSSTNFVLVERKSGLIQQTALCQNGLYYHKSLLNTTSLVYLHDPEGWVCYNGKVATFALFKSKLYFIVIGEFENKWRQTTTKVELRVMQSCRDCGAPNITDFNTLGAFRAPYLFNCSKRIAEIYNSRRKGDNDVMLKSAHSLKITDENGYLSFFFQVFVARNFTTTKEQFVDLDLYHATGKGTVQLLHTEKIPKHYARWKINGIGGLDYKKERLCWTGADRIYCGQFRDGRLNNSRMIMYPGDSVSSGVCKGDRPNLLPIITSLSIIDVLPSNITLVFGCYAQWPGLGGTGIIILPHDEKQCKQIIPIYINRSNQRLRMGSLFTTYSVAQYCEPYYDLPMCDDPNRPLDMKIRSFNRSDKLSKKMDIHYSREAVYTVIKAANDTEIQILDYSDLQNQNNLLSKKDRDLFDEKGIGKGTNLSCSCILCYCMFILIPIYGNSVIV